jgi:murein DD-endopeptidase MepM/ murein hydrolase activator NlpD
MLENENLRNGPLYLDMDIGEKITVATRSGSATELVIHDIGYDGPAGTSGDWMNMAWAQIGVGGAELRITLGEAKRIGNLRIGLEMIREYSVDPWRRKRQNEIWKLDHDARLFACDARGTLVPVGSHTFPISCSGTWRWDGEFYNRYARKSSWEVVPLHEGVDIICPVGSQRILAAHGGRVFFIGGYRLADDKGSEGIGVFIHGDDNICYMYFHLDSLSPSVRLGQRVEIGESLGASGNSGFEKTNEEPHLHFGMWLPQEVKDHYECENIWEWDSHNDGFVINPEPYLSEWFGI